uniref:Phospholipase n=1 Tax=Oryza nivara TaxID=4536 RepID=A0A0E0FKU1_ORYNI
MSGGRSAAREGEEAEEEEYGGGYVRMPQEPEGEAAAAGAGSFLRLPESAGAFDELPRARIVGVSRPDAGDITPMLLSYTVEVQYKQVKEWLQNLGIGEHMPVVHDDDEADDVHVPSQHDEHSVKNRNVPSSAVLPVIRPALGRQQSVSDRAKVAMQEYLNHFLGNMEIVNSREVWAVLKPGFLALLQDPFDPKLLDIVIFDVSPHMDRNGEGQSTLAREIKEHNPLHFAFEIFITDWWLCPELYLRRPFHHHESSRLDILLESRAKQGVQYLFVCNRFGSIKCLTGSCLHEMIIDKCMKFNFADIGCMHFKIYILLYKEVSLALKINSMYSKQRLLNIHENVKVLRYPDHFSTGIYLWSHHEKIVIVDNQVCYIGGLDLCFGRYDTPEHKVVDVPPSIWPGKDYYNPRESEPNSWEDTMKDELDRTKYPRMPWHDVQCALYGPACRDIARHFVQRWNYAKRNKAPNEQAIPLLMPQHHMVIPHYMGKIKESNEEVSKQTHVEDIKGQKLSSLKAPASCQDIPLLLPHEPDHQASNNGELGLNGLDNNHGHSDHPNKTHWKQPIPNRKAKQDTSLQDLQMKGFVDNLGTPDVSSVIGHYDTSKQNVHHMDNEWWETQERGDQVDYVLDIGEVGPRATCCCQVVRSVGPWSAGTTQIEGSIHNAYFSLIEKAEHFVYIENQFFISGLSGDDTIKNRVLEALYRRILRAEKEKRCFRVIIVIPLLPGFQGGIDDGGAASVRAIMHWQYRTICRGPNSILKNLYDVVGSKAHDYISFYGLRAHGRLGDGGPLVTNQIYVHSKLMIIDDRMTLIGSANINDRSLLGSRDSEIGMIIEDKEVVSSIMDGRHWEAGKFSLSLRLSLWAEHLGLHPGEVSQIMDPVDDLTYNNIWMGTAKANTKIYQNVFSCVPDDHIHSRSQFRQGFAHRKEKIGHTTIDLGVAVEITETHKDGDLAGTDPMEKLQAVRGHLVSFPLEFMCQEDLRPFFGESEYYTSPQVFH